MIAAKRTTAKLNRGRLGWPGIDGFIVTLEVREDDKRIDSERRRDARSRQFHVVAALAKFVPFPDDIQASLDEGAGESYVVAPKQAKEVQLQGPWGTYRFVKNARGELATVSATITANRWPEAFKAFLSGLAPFLDRLSFDADVPIVIEKLYCHDRDNHLHVASYKMPYTPRPLLEDDQDLIGELFPVYGLYREAKNSSSNYYKLLCYYKILEGVYAQLRPTLMRRARQQNISISTRKELVPYNDELQRGRVLDLL